MTKQPAKPTQQSLRALIADDSYAMEFQTVGQYRSTLLQLTNSINREPQAGIVEIVEAGAPPAPGIDLSGLVRYDFVGLDGESEQFVQVDTAGYYIAHEVEALVARATGDVDLTRRYATGGIVPAELYLAGESLRPLAAKPAQPAEAFAWAVFAENDNVIVWSKNRAQVESASTKYGRPIVPVIALTVGQQAATRDVLIERQRQMEVEGWTAERDDKYIKCELARAAATYATCSHIDQLKLVGEAAWPWHPDWFKRSSYRRDLVKAGALVLAEIERLDRATVSREGT